MKINVDEVLEKVKALPQEYWIKQFKAIEKDRTGLIEDLNAEFIYLFDLTRTQIKDAVSLYFSKYANEGIIDERTHNTKLTRAELADLKADIEKTQKDLDELKLTFDKDIQSEIKKLGTTTTRLQALKLRIKVKIFYLYSVLGNRIYDHMKAVTDHAYSHTVYEVFNACGYGSKDVKALSDEEMAVILALIWRATEETFDSVVWRYSRTFMVEVNQYIGRATFSQRALDEILLYLDKRFNTKVNELDLLLRTDSTFFATQGQDRAFNELEIEEAVFTAILDERTSDFCREADGNVIPVEDIRPWENAPPLHYYCRSTMVPIVREVNFLTGDVYEIDGKYDDWYDQYYLE